MVSGERDHDAGGGRGRSRRYSPSAVSAVGVIYVKDLDRMSAFYEQCLGFATVEGGDRYRVLAAEEWTLSLVRAAEELWATIEISAPARRRTEVPIKLGFAVRSIEEIRAGAEALGGYIDPPDTAWDFRDFRRCDGVDPEGNVIQLLEPLSAQA